MAASGRNQGSDGKPSYKAHKNCETPVVNFLDDRIDADVGTQLHELPCAHAFEADYDLTVSCGTESSWLSHVRTRKKYSTLGLTHFN